MSWRAPTFQIAHSTPAGVATNSNGGTARLCYLRFLVLVEATRRLALPELLRARRLPRW